jgi:hypothetical protein
LRERGYNTPDKILEIPLEDVPKIVGKPVHARKLRDLITGRSLKTFAIQVVPDGPDDASNGVVRQPTPRADKNNASTSLLRRVTSIRASAVNDTENLTGKTHTQT